MSMPLYLYPQYATCDIINQDNDDSVMRQTAVLLTHTHTLPDFQISTENKPVSPDSCPECLPKL